MLTNRQTDTAKNIQRFSLCYVGQPDHREYTGTLTFHRHSRWPASFLSHIWWASELSRGPCQIAYRGPAYFFCMGPQNLKLRHCRPTADLYGYKAIYILHRQRSCGGEPEPFIKPAWEAGYFAGKTKFLVGLASWYQSLKGRSICEYCKPRNLAPRSNEFKEELYGTEGETVRHMGIYLGQN